MARQAPSRSDIPPLSDRDGS